ncbi:40s ribosomal protein s5-1 [Hordeum vulgare]|nr:40s ribosomal protein s5-1 [Hordeum vulgare]
MEQQVFKCQVMVERGLNANHMMITEYTNKHKIDANDIGKHLSRLYDRIDHLQAQIYDLQNQNCLKIYVFLEMNLVGLLLRELKKDILLKLDRIDKHFGKYGLPTEDRMQQMELRAQFDRQGGGAREEGQLMLTAEQWRARERRRGGAHGEDYDDGARSEASGFGGNRRGRCYKCGERGHFKRECPQWKKAPAAQRALLVDGNVEDARLL